MKLLKIVKKHLIGAILVSITLGLIVGYNFEVSWLKNLILPLTFMLVYPMLVTLDFKSLLSNQITHFKLQHSL